jgi:hypothetical protein
MYMEMQTFRSEDEWDDVAAEPGSKDGPEPPEVFFPPFRNRRTFGRRVIASALLRTP